MEEEWRYRGGGIEVEEGWRYRGGRGGGIGYMCVHPIKNVEDVEAK